MFEFLPYITNDNSVGLYNKNVDDIYHSASGALSEAFEKFVLPINLKKFLLNCSDINVLDICYGIGYNTKAFLTEFLKYNSYDINKITIDCVDTNSNIIKLSPFISSNVNMLKTLFNKELISKNVSTHKKALDILMKSKLHFVNKYKIPQVVNLILLKNLIRQYSEEIFSEDIKKLLNDKTMNIYFNGFMLNFIKNSDLFGIYLHQNKYKTAFVHNIYYENISKQYNMYKNITKNSNITLNFIANDIRNVIQNTNTVYDIIFLDGFTPAKCPCIWSEEFFKYLYNKLSETGLLLTYNMSAPVRHAMINAGFYIGNNINNNNCIGTIATKNKKLITNELTKQQKGLLHTKAGITYKDLNLCNKNDDILNLRNEEVKNSELESSSKYLKRFKNEI